MAAFPHGRDCVGTAARICAAGERQRKSLVGGVSRTWVYEMFQASPIVPANMTRPSTTTNERELTTPSLDTMHLHVLARVTQQHALSRRLLPASEEFGFVSHQYSLEPDLSIRHPGLRSLRLASVSEPSCLLVSGPGYSVSHNSCASCRYVPNIGFFGSASVPCIRATNQRGTDTHLETEADHMFLIVYMLRTRTELASLPYPG